MKKKIIIALTLVVGLTGAGLVVMQQSNGSSTSSALQVESRPLRQKQNSVRIEKVEMISLKRNATYPGSIQAVNKTQLAFRVGGPLIRVNIMPGDRVTSGQVLMQIDPKDFNDYIRVLEAQLDGARVQEIDALQDLDRAKRLFREKVVPQVDFDHATTEYKSALASIKQILAQLETARHQLEYTTLRAPYDGIITSQLVENHEMVSVGQVVLKLHDISKLEITINIPENEIFHHSLARGEKGIVTFPGLGERTFHAHLKEWNTQADDLTRTYEMTFLMAAPGDVQILPGMTAEVVWADQTIGAPVMTIPAGAVISKGNKESLVWVFNPNTNTASRLAITLGQLNGASRVCVKTGLKPGDLIVTRGMDFIVRDMILTDIVPLSRNTTQIN